MARPSMIDYYGQLEVERGADEVTIKKSYRKLVLKCHPDKNPEDREGAEEKIRVINAAYETLSNPAKRAAYDMQLRAMDIKNQGLRVDTSRIQPRMSIPKAFMLCPMGYPDKFMRMIGRSLAFHSRSDVNEVEFEDFFKVARFTLWWLPEVNNMCRLRTQPHIGGGSVFEVSKKGNCKGKMTGPPVGQILSFGLSHQTSISDVMISDIEQPTCCNIIAVASPDFPGAFRFESAFFPGHFLAFHPPAGVQMMRVTEKFSVIDYMLMDFGVCETFKTLDEALLPAVLSLGGEKQFVKLTSVCQDTRVLTHFKATMGNATWDYNDFALYFHAHSDRWEYDANQQLLRLRGPEEKLALSLKRAEAVDEVVTRLIAEKQELRWLPLDVVDHVLQLLSKPVSTVTGKTQSTGSGESHKAAVVKLLTVVRDMCGGRSRVSLDELDGLIQLWRAITNFAGKDDDSDIKQLRSETIQSVGRCASRLLIDPGVSSVGVDALHILLDMRLEWEKWGPVIAPKAQPGIAKMSLEEMTPLLRKAGKAGANKLGESLATSAMMKTFGASPECAVEALDAMVSGGFLLDGAAMTLKRLQETLTSFESSARVVAGLIERDADFSDLDDCWEILVNKAALEALPASLFTRLSAAAIKSSAVHGAKLTALGNAASAALASDKWSVEDVIELLLTITGRGDAGSSASQRKAQLTSVIEFPVNEFLRSKLEHFSAVNLNELISGILRIKVCRPLLESAAAQLASQFPSMSPSQLLAVTKELKSLGNKDAIFHQVVDLWKKRLADDAAKTVSACDKAESTLNPGDLVHISGLTSESGSRLNDHSGNITRFITEKGRFEVRMAGGFSNGECVSVNPKNLKKDRPKWRQMLQGLGADQLAELAQLFTGVEPEHGVFDALAENLAEQMEALSPEGSALLDSALRTGIGGSKFRRQIGRERDRSNSRGREGDQSRNHGRERGRSRSRGRERNRSRSREKERDRSRSRGRARNRSRSREKERDRSRSRGRARNRSQGRGRRR